MPNQTNSTNQPSFEDDEINLLDYWRVIYKRKSLITLIVLFSIVTTAIYSLRMTDVYQSRAVITPISKKGGGGEGGLSAIAQQFGGLPGISLPGSVPATEIVNLLNSNILKKEIIEKYNLLPVLFYKAWDAKRKTWKVERKKGFSLSPSSLIKKITARIKPENQVLTKYKKKHNGPTMWDAIRTLDGMIGVKNNTRDNTISVMVDYYDPEVAAVMVKNVLSTLNEHMSREARRVAETNKRFLERQLKRTSDPLIRQKIYNLIAQQIETSMMAGEKENFAFKVIDPPMVPDRKIKPKRMLMVMLSLVVSLFGAIFLAFFIEYIEKARQKDG